MNNKDYINKCLKNNKDGVVRYSEKDVKDKVLSGSLSMTLSRKNESKKIKFLISKFKDGKKNMVYEV